jgi:hypothetical protein
MPQPAATWPFSFCRPEGCWFESSPKSQPSLGFAELRLGRLRRPLTLARHYAKAVSPKLAPASEGGLAQILLDVVAPFHT